MVTRYQDVAGIIKDRSFGNTGIPEQLVTEMHQLDLVLSSELRELLYGFVLFEEMEVHRAHRFALQTAFQGDYWGQLEAIVVSQSHPLIQRLSPSTDFDGVCGLAASIWDNVFTAWLNLPPSLQATIQQEKSAIRLLLDPSSIDASGIRRLMLAMENLDRGFTQLLERHFSGHDSLLFRALMHGYEGSEHRLRQRFSTDCITLLIGGSETSEALTGNLLFLLAQRPELQQQLRESPGLIRGVIQETMRYESPLQMARRTVKNPVEMHGRVLSRGDNLLLCLGAANRDERIFESADQFIPERKNARLQLGFGAGAHQCIGQLLAQLLSGQITLALLRKGKIQLAGVPSWSQKNILVRSLASLPLRLS